MWKELKTNNEIIALTLKNNKLKKIFQIKNNYNTHIKQDSAYKNNIRLEQYDVIFYKIKIILKVGKRIKL